jgi:hypothetical protein
LSRIRPGFPQLVYPRCYIRLISARTAAWELEAAPAAEAAAGHMDESQVDALKLSERVADVVNPDTPEEAEAFSPLYVEYLAEHGEDELAMPLYLSKFSYTPETWTRLMANPEDRREAARSYIESVGGKLHGFWYAFGSHDGYNLGKRRTTCRWRRSRWRSREGAR